MLALINLEDKAAVHNYEKTPARTPCQKGTIAPVHLIIFRSFLSVRGREPGAPPLIVLHVHAFNLGVGYLSRDHSSGVFLGAESSQLENSGTGASPRRGGRAAPSESAYLARGGFFRLPR